VFVLLCTIFFAAADNNRPVIAVLTQPTTSNYVSGPQYVAASYVKWLESGGARVIPFRYGTSAVEIKKVFNSINGIVFPGGGDYFTVPSPFYTTLTTLWDLIVDANINGDYFPVWGTCFGFELLNILVSKNLNILGHFNSENYTIPLNFTSFATSSRLFGFNESWFAGKSFITPDIFHSLLSQPITMNNHQAGVSPDTFYTTPDLYNFFTPLSYNNDRDGKTFVSSFECKVTSKSGGWKLPIYATQYHPEKPQFEWDPYEVIQHTTDAIWANQYHSNFFVRETRKSSHTWVNQTELIHDYLIYNWAPEYSYLQDPEFEQTYVFPAPTQN